LGARPLASSEIEFSFLNINLNTSRVRRWIAFDQDAASGILADENLEEPITNARQGNRSNESFDYEACGRSGRLASGRSAADEELRDIFPASDALGTAKLTAPVMAQGSHTRHFGARVDDSATNGARYIDGRVCVPAPRVGAFATQPWDNAPPCEPSKGY
jgi:hypothetical protein